RARSSSPHASVWSGSWRMRERRWLAGTSELYAGWMSDNQEPARRKIEIPQDMHTFNQGVIAEHRANAGRLSGMMEGRTVLLLTTTGRRSGQPRTVVLGYGRHGDGLVVLASNNGAPSHPAWYLKLLPGPT